jgi:hypothetical protein
VFSINLIYNFSTLATAILGAAYTDMKVIGILGFEEALKYGDVVTKHEVLKPVITGLPGNANMLTFILFQDSSGNKLVLAQEYIDAATVVVVTLNNIQVDIIGVDTATETTLRARLLELGISNFTITKV